MPIETGPSFVNKCVIRKVAGWRSLSDYRHYESHSLSNALRMVFATRSTELIRPAYGDPGSEAHSHNGFNWRLLRARVNEWFTIERTEFTPLGYGGAWFGSQAWFVGRRALRATTTADATPCVGPCATLELDHNVFDSLRQGFLRYRRPVCSMIQSIRRAWKLWFIYRPVQLVRRTLVEILPPSPGYQWLSTIWGMRVRADPTRTIGRCILTTGLYDLAVSEVLARLIIPGDTVIDAGANVGYMTLLACVAAGPGGRVLSFEPHPDLFTVLRQNVASARERSGIAHTELHNTALGDHAGTAELLLPSDFASNDGTARMLYGAGTDGDSLSVNVETIDDALGTGSASVLKLDVEGSELMVLRGAVRALKARRVKHIVFEDHNAEGSEVVRFLRENGFRICSLGWSMRGLVLRPVEAGKSAADYEAPNFVASLEPREVLRRCQRRGWSVLKSRLA